MGRSCVILLEHEGLEQEKTREVVRQDRAGQVWIPQSLRRGRNGGRGGQERLWGWGWRELDARTPGPGGGDDVSCPAYRSREGERKRRGGTREKFS